MTILAVDPDAEALKALTLCLDAAFPQGEIHGFCDPLSAVKYGFNHRIDAIFTEIDMKLLSGFDLVRLIRERQAAEPAVCFLSEAPGQDLSPGLLAAEGYLAKPVTPDTVQNALMRRGN